ncbi:MAG: hypothetical protein ACKOFA_06980, partial [Rhodoluna sp.]
MFWRKLTNSLIAISLASFFTLAATQTIQAAPSQPQSICAEGFELQNETCVATFGYSQLGTQFKVPEGLGAVQIEVIGAAGGSGGLDCGAGCVVATSGPAGKLLLQFEDLSGAQLGLYPGQRGANGANGANSSGGGPGGLSSYLTEYSGGRGGNTGSVGSSGGGGGGGAASLVVIDGKEYIAAGGGGGGGSANAPQGSTSGVNDGKISVGAIGVNVFEGGQSTYTAPRDLSFTGSKLRYEASNNPRCGQDHTPDVVGKKSYTVSAYDSIWGDPCYGQGKRIVGSLFYALGSIGGQGQDSSCDFSCDGAGAGGGGGGLNGGAGGALFRSSNSLGEAGGGGGSSGSNSATGGVVLQSEYVTSDADGSITIRYVPVFPPSEVIILSDAKTNSRSHTLQVLVKGSKELAESEIQLTGSALGQASFKITALTETQEKGQTRYSFRITQSGNQNIQGNLSAAIRSVQSNIVELDQIAP